MTARVQRCVSIAIAVFIGASFSVAETEENSTPVTPVPFAGLLMNPNIPPDVTVSVIGYFEGNFLFLTKAHADASDYASAITILDRSDDAEIYQSSCRANYVKITGDLSRSESGELKLDNIRNIKYAENRRDCYRKRDSQ